MTHLFNAMQSFHHRDPGLVGLLASEKLGNNQVILIFAHYSTFTLHQKHLLNSSIFIFDNFKSMSASPRLQVWCGIIADGVHTHPTSIRIAYKTNFKSLVLVTDAILAMGYKDGKYQFGQQEIEVCGDQAWVAGTSTLTGSVATMQRSVVKFLK